MKQNKFKICKDYVIGYDHNDKEFYLDIDDYEKVKNICWLVGDNGYVKNRYRNLYLHRFVMDCPSDMVVDHIDHNPTNNRKSNLRICKQQQNAINKSIQSNNKTNVVGVHFEKTRNKWVAELTLKHKKVFWQSFDNFEDAVKARQTAENKFFGEFKPNNN